MRLHMIFSSAARSKSARFASITALLCLASLLNAQPRDDDMGMPPPPPHGADGTPPPHGHDDDRDLPRERFNPVEFRARAGAALKRRLESMQREGTELQGAIAKLDGGATLREVFKAYPLTRRVLDQAMREDPEFRAGSNAAGGRGGPGASNREDRARPERENATRQGSRGRPERGFGRPSSLDPFVELDPLIRDPRAERLPPLDRDLTTAERTEVNEFLASAIPNLKEQLVKLESHDEAAAQERYRQLFPKLERSRALKREDPELYALVLEGLRLRGACIGHAKWIARNESDTAKKTEVQARQAELKTVLGQSFVVADKVRQRLAERRLRERERIIDELAQYMVNKERLNDPEMGPPGDDRDGPPPPDDRPPPRERRGRGEPPPPNP